MLRDTDFGYGIWGKSPVHDTLSFALGDLIEPGAEYANTQEIVFLLKTLLKNDEFRNEFVRRFADQINTSFQPERVNQEIDKSKAAIELEMPERCDRWQVMGVTMETWYRDIEYMKYYANERPDYVRGHIVSKFGDNGVSGTASVKLNSDSSKGYIRINSIDIKASTPGVKTPDEWTGIYFKGVPVTLKAVPMEGYKFCGWEGITGEAQTSDTITFTLDEDMNITAVYKPISTEITYGDLNGDNEINSIDFAILRSYLLDIIKESSVPVENADLNGDGKINSIDFAWFRKYLLGMITDFPVLKID